MDNKETCRSSEEFADFSLKELKERNLKERGLRGSEVTQDQHRSRVLDALKGEEGIVAVTISFCDAEGRLLMLDYDKDYFVENYEGLTFDGSSVSGFSSQENSDLRLKTDFSSLRWLPAEVFGTGKVLLFADVCNQDGSPYAGDMRVRLGAYLETIKEQSGLTALVAPEIEGMLLEGRNAELEYDDNRVLRPAMKTGYFHALPVSPLREFMDNLARVTRALGFKNERDHAEVAPGQFELTYNPADPITAAENALLYKIAARQIADQLGMTASFLPKPVIGVNGSGMHTNISIARKGENIFYDETDKYHVSKECRRAIWALLSHAKEFSLAFCSSVNAFRRLDPKYEAPNEIKASPADRGSMVRVPWAAGKKSARIEVRSVAPDSNPFLVNLLLIRALVEGVMDGHLPEVKFSHNGEDVDTLPTCIQESVNYCAKSGYVAEIMGGESRDKFVETKREVADSAPRVLGDKFVPGEIKNHHEVRTQ